MLNIEVLDFTATTGTATTDNDLETKMRKTTANDIRTTHKADRKDRRRQTPANARMAAQSRQYDFRRGGYRR